MERCAAWALPLGVLVCAHFLTERGPLKEDCRPVNLSDTATWISYFGDAPILRDPRTFRKSAAKTSC